MRLFTWTLAALVGLSLSVAASSAATIFATGQNNGDPTHQSGNYYYSIDTNTGVATPISPMLSGGSPAALAGTPDGRLLGIQNRQLAEINPFTGVSTNIGAPATQTTTALDVLSDGRGFVTPFEDGFGPFTQTQNLYNVDLTNGQYAAITTGRTIGDAIDAAAGTPLGTAEPFIISLGSVGTTLYGVDLDTNSLIELDPDTGAAAVVGAVGAVQPAGLPVYTGFAAMTGVDTNADGIYDALFGNVNFLDPDGPGAGTQPSQRLGGVARYDLNNGTWTMVGTNPGLIFFGFGAPIPEPAAGSLMLLMLGGVALGRRRFG